MWLSVRFPVKLPQKDILKKTQDEIHESQGKTYLLRLACFQSDSPGYNPPADNPAVFGQALNFPLGRSAKDYWKHHLLGLCGLSFFWELCARTEEGTL